MNTGMLTVSSMQIRVTGVPSVLTPASLSTAMVAGTESKALPLFVPQAPPDTAGTEVWPCNKQKLQALATAS